MKETKKVTVKGEVFSGTAIYVEKISSILAIAYELTIQDGIVVSKKQVNRAADLPVMVIKQASDVLWRQFRGDN